MAASEALEKGRSLAEEFVLWLWCRGLTEGGASQGEDGTAFLLGDSIQLHGDTGEVKEVTLRKGTPAESEEALSCLRSGMRPVKVKARYLDGELEWSFVLTAATLDLTPLKPPTIKARQVEDLAEVRLDLLERVYEALDQRFKEFLVQRIDDPAGFETGLRDWLGLPPRPVAA